MPSRADEKKVLSMNMKEMPDTTNTRKNKKMMNPLLDLKTLPAVAMIDITMMGMRRKDNSLMNHAIQ